MTPLELAICAIDVAMWERIQKFIDRAESRLSLWLAIGGSSVMGLFTGWLSSGVAWINQFGWFGWWLSGLLGALLTATLLMALSWARYAWVRAGVQQKWAQNVDAFNPLDVEHRSKRIRILELMHPITKHIENKRLYDCELIGPANIFMYQHCMFNRIEFYDCVAVAIQADNSGRIFPGEAVVLKNLEIHGGTIFGATLYVPPQFVQMIADIGVPFITFTGVKKIDDRLLQHTEAETQR